MKSCRLLPIAGAVLLAAAAWWAFAPGFSGPFLLDDVPQIAANPMVQVQHFSVEALATAALSSSAGPLGRPLPMASFALDHIVHGLDPVGFKHTNFIVHLLTGWALFLFARAVVLAGGGGAVRAVRAAGIVAALWLVHPLALTPVLYVVQRMTSLAALGVLLSLACYLTGRRRYLAGRPGWGWFATAGFFFLTAAASKENALLVPLFILLAEWLLLRFRTATARGRRILIGFLLLTVALPAAAALAWLWADPNSLLGGYARRDFTLTERLLTEARVLWIYVQMTWLPRPADFALYHDDIVISKGLLSPLTTLPAVLAWGTAAVAVVGFRKRAPLLAFGTTFFLVGHTLESTLIPLEIAFEHRNYLPMVGLLLPIGGALSIGLDAPARRIPLAVLSLLLFAALITMTHSRSLDWSEPMRQWQAAVEHHPRSIRANLELGRMHFLRMLAAEDATLRMREYRTASSLYRRAAALKADSADPLILHWILDLYAGTPSGDLVATMWQRLDTDYWNSGTTSLLAEVVRLNASRAIALPEDQYRHLVSLVSVKENAVSRGRADILSAIALDQLRRGYPDKAVEFAERTLSAYSRDPQHWLNYIDLLASLGRCKEALQAETRFSEARVIYRNPQRAEKSRSGLRQRCTTDA